MNKGIRIFKIIDPVIQTLIFLYLVLHMDNGKSYYPFLWILMGYQILSVIVNVFLKYKKKKKAERFAFLACACVCIYYVYTYAPLANKNFKIEYGKRVYSWTNYELALTGISIALSFWYFTVCFREIRKALKKITRE